MDFKTVNDSSDVGINLGSEVLSNIANFYNTGDKMSWCI